MSVEGCLGKTNFDYFAYVNACFSLACTEFIWQPPGDFPRVERSFPTHQRPNDKKKMAALYAWANRTDPDARIRVESAKRVWEDRRIGEEIVFPHQYAVCEETTAERNYHESGNSLAMCS